MFNALGIFLLGICVLVIVGLCIFLLAMSKFMPK